jgi:hypothetical protein
MKKIIIVLIAFSLAFYACVKKEPGEPQLTNTPTMTLTVTMTGTVPSATVTETATDSFTSTETPTITETVTATMTATYPCTGAGDAGVFSANTTLNVVNGGTLGYKINLAEEVTVDKMQVLADNTTEGGYDLEAAIYTDDSDYPGSLVGSPGSINVAAPAAGLYDIPLNVHLAAGNYWIVLRTKNNISSVIPLQFMSTSLGVVIQIDQANALPGVFPAGAYTGQSEPRMSIHWVCP